VYRLPADGRKWDFVCRQRRALAQQLASHADRDGRNIWVGRQRLADALDLSPREIDYLLADLVALGFLRNEGWHDGVRKRSLDLEAIFMASGHAQNSPVATHGGLLQNTGDLRKIEPGHAQNRTGKQPPVLDLPLDLPQKSKAFDPPTGASEGWDSNATSSSEAHDDDVEIERQAFRRFGMALPHGKPRQFLSSELARVIEAFNSSPVIARRARNADRDVAMKLLQICSCEEIERGIVLGTARRMGSDNSAPEPVKVSSLAYFAPAIAEARSDPLMTEEYIARCRAAIERELSRRKKEPQRATA
jgi:hypothetical protein